MQISSSGYRGPASHQANSSKEGEKLGRAEAVADLFNNPINDDEPRRDVKLRLSYASRRLAHDLKMGIEELLQQEPKLKATLEEIELPANAYSRIDPNQLPTRKLSAYLGWLRIHEGREGEPEESEAPFLALHDLGNDDQIRSLFENYDAQRKEIQQVRTQQAPSYYYSAYPEAYSFN